MKNVPLMKCDLNASEVALGCMRIDGMADAEAARLIHTALDAGINFFDHADVYGGGRCESKFAEALGMNAALRERMILQTKVGIRKGSFDFSKEHLLNAVDGSLKRLQTDFLDVVLLHRPDALVEPEEVAEAFTTLEQAGKVRWFGVSNQNPMQIELLRRYVEQPIIFNQLQLSVTNTAMIDAGINVNMQNPPSVDHDGSILDYCRLHDITRLKNPSQFLVCSKASVTNSLVISVRYFYPFVRV